MISIAADAWYETVPFADGIALIHEPWIPPFFRCNMWLVRGRDRDLLVDAGLGAVPLRANMPLLSGRPVLLLASHTHFDHIGAAHEFAERLVHPAEAGVLADPANDATLFSHYASGDADAEMFDALPPGWDARRYRIPPAPATGLVGEGDRIDLGDRVLTVLETPGHSPGHVSLFEEATGTLIAQDVIYDGALVDDCAGADKAVYRATLRRLRELEPRIVHGGHFQSFGRTRFRQLIDAYLGAQDPGDAG
ncbi:MBL fold metallo-hydrolase [Methylobrevis albus]|uniref:MBL fold metallo-hydrolase n=1 Tax=Methylobrevis albus TaxID=2793297 RepID=A0A931HZG3_9HYPH|nr:MBL fold metallo-hydrolase [Methylobrevis albus]MBH0237315.1 MBL fold metallo-hydrolase [Methylobrevis albus]